MELVEDVKTYYYLSSPDYPVVKERKEVFLTSEDEKILKDILKDIEKICLDEKIPPVINEKMCKQCSYYEFCYI